MKKYEAVYFEEEPGERVAEWHVVEWVSLDSEPKIGRSIAKYYNSSFAEQKAKEQAEILNGNVA